VDRESLQALENTIRTTNEMTLTATKIVSTAWEKGVAKGLAQKDSPFNEYIEREWVEQWLFYANSTRFASAMAGSDYRGLCRGTVVLIQEYPGDDRSSEYDVETKKISCWLLDTGCWIKKILILDKKMLD